MLDGLILCDFRSEVLYVSNVVFKGSILGGACQFWGNPYLNSTTVLFDNQVMRIIKSFVILHNK